jgi:phospholipase C
MVQKNLRWMASVLLAANLAAVTPGPALAAPGNNKGGTTTTPIKHVVVIFQENVSFDHYFATYPMATNPRGEVKFKAKAGTPTVNGLTQGLIDHNQNTDKAGTVYQPVRLDPSQNYTCDMNHDYTPEQQAFDSGLMDKFPEFDGNTVQGLWNYAQNFAMSDNSFGSTYGPSTPGAIEVVSGMTGGADLNAEAGAVAAGDVVTTTLNGVTASAVIGDPDPWYDDCSGAEKVGMLSTNKNVGDLLGAKGISWGWFQGGFTPTTAATATAPAACKTTTNRIDGTPEAAYSAHHNPFQYYKSTSNPHHLPPTGVSEIGHDGQANHQYDLTWFQKAAKAGNLPAVSYLKANRANDGHPSNSSPLDEQLFIVNVVNFLQTLPEWQDTAVIITWDDSDGWYDHVMPPIVNMSTSAADALTGVGMCGNGTGSLAAQQARCGYGPRLPFLVISPFAKKNFVDSTLIDQSSVVKFIEENWDLPQIGNGSFDQIAGPIDNMFNWNKQNSEKVILDPSTGQVISDN